MPLARFSCRLQTSSDASRSGGSTAGRRTNPCPSPSAVQSPFPCGRIPLSPRREMPQESHCRAPWTPALRSEGRASPRSNKAKKGRLNSVFALDELSRRNKCHVVREPNLTSEKRDIYREALGNIHPVHVIR